MFNRLSFSLFLCLTELTELRAKRMAVFVCVHKTFILHRSVRPRNPEQKGSFVSQRYIPSSCPSSPIYCCLVNVYVAIETVISFRDIKDKVI